MEPRDLWEKRIDAKWHDKAPRIEMLDESGDYIVIDGMRPRPLAFEGPMADLKAQGMEIPVPKGYRYEQNRPGSWDPNERLKDQDLDGVSGEVIYPGVGLHIVRAPDAEYLYACCRAYNDWLAEYCSVHPARLKGAALLPNRGPIEWAVSEAERAAKMGLVTAMLPSFMDDRAYNLPEWDRLWAALQDMNIVASMHLCGREPYGIAHGPGAGGINVGVIKFGMYDTVMRLIWGGAPMRFPKLKWSMVEGGIGWIASVVQFMDHWWDDHRGWMEPKLPETPSYYFHRQFFATFEDVSGRDLSWFWRTWFFETWRLDQAIDTVVTVGDSLEVGIENRGRAPMPVHLVVTRTDGRVDSLNVPVDVWLGEAKRTTVRVAKEPAVRSIEIDPAREFPDVDRDNQRWPR